MQDFTHTTENDPVGKPDLKEYPMELSQFGTCNTFSCTFFFVKKHWLLPYLNLQDKQSWIESMILGFPLECVSFILGQLIISAVWHDNYSECLSNHFPLISKVKVER